MSEFTARQYAQSAAEVVMEGVKGILHLGHCAVQLAEFYIIEKCDAADQRMAARVDLGDVDGNA